MRVTRCTRSPSSTAAGLQDLHDGSLDGWLGAVVSPVQMRPCVCWTATALEPSASAALVLGVRRQLPLLGGSHGCRLTDASLRHDTSAVQHCPGTRSVNPHTVALVRAVSWSISRALVCGRLPPDLQTWSALSGRRQIVQQHHARALGRQQDGQALSQADAAGKPVVAISLDSTCWRDPPPAAALL